MKIFNCQMLPKGWFEWLVGIAVGYIYLTWTIQLLLKAEAINNQVSDQAWTIEEHIAAFPAFYFNLEPLTSLVINSILWGWVFAKVFGLLIHFISRLIKK